MGQAIYSWVLLTAASAGAPSRVGPAETVTGLHALIQDNYAETPGILPALTLLAMLAFIVHIDRYIRADRKKIMRIILALLFTLVAQNWLENRLAVGQLRWLARTLVTIYGYAVRSAILVFFLKVIAPQKRCGWAYALVAVNAAVNATALFSHICSSATSGSGSKACAEALCWLEHERADVALLDIDMPGMTGIELAAAIRERWPDMPVIFLTGYSQYALETYKVHPTSYLLKPVKKEKLAVEIAYAASGFPRKQHSQKWRLPRQKSADFFGVGASLLDIYWTGCDIVYN